MVKHMLDCHPEQSEGSRSMQDMLMGFPATRFFVAALLRMTGTSIQGVQHVADHYVASIVSIVSKPCPGC